MSLNIPGENSDEEGELPPVSQSGLPLDPGDETAERYRYQAIIAAIFCCSILDKTRGVAEVFCEHLEDILVVRHDSSLVGVQVKTKSQDQPVWKTGDEGVRNSLARFAVLDHTYPGKFRSFRFLTNHPVHVGRNGQNPRFVVDEVKQTTSFDNLDRKVQNPIRRVAKDVELEPEDVFSTLRKVKIQSYLPKLKDGTLRLINTLAVSWPEAERCSHARLERVANELASECFRRASLASDEALTVYFQALAGEEEVECARIEGKRMDFDRLTSLLNDCLDSVAPLEGQSGDLVKPGAGSDDLLEKKLLAGGLGVVSLNSARDLRDKADYLAISWRMKLGNERGLQRYSHVRSIVLSDAADAFEECERADSKFGKEMRAALKARLEGRVSSSTETYDCSTSHLEGYAYGMTGECKIQWSLDRPWEG